MKYAISTKGLMCGHCEATVEAALLKVAGVTDADADHESNVVEVECSEGVEPAALKDAIEAVGSYEVLEISAA